MNEEADDEDRTDSVTFATRLGASGSDERDQGRTPLPTPVQTSWQADGDRFNVALDI